MNKRFQTPEEKRALWLWLADALGPAAVQAGDIVRMYPHPQMLFEECRTTDLSCILHPSQLRNLHMTQPEDFVARLDECRQNGVSIVCYDEDDYPALLREIPSPPPVLYYRGDITILQRCFTFAIVGARRPSAYGVEATARIAAPLAEAGVALISGLASGLDSEAHKIALRQEAPTVACIAFGHEHCYPGAHKKLKTLLEEHGLVIGEYPPHMPPRKDFFLQRNRLIAGLSQGICVAEAKRASGTMNTVSAALEYGRDVFAVPGSIFSPLSEGTNHLLAEGAQVAVCGEDILGFYDLRPKEAQQSAGEASLAKDEPDDEEMQIPKLSEAAAAVYRAMSAQAQALPVLCEKTGMPTAKVMAGLTELELCGLIRALPGRQYVLK